MPTGSQATRWVTIDRMVRAELASVVIASDLKSRQDRVYKVERRTNQLIRLKMHRARTSATGIERSKGTNQFHDVVAARVDIRNSESKVSIFVQS